MLLPWQLQLHNQATPQSVTAIPQNKWLWPHNQATLALQPATLQRSDFYSASMQPTGPTNMTPINQHCTGHTLWPHTTPTQELGQLLMLPLHQITILPMLTEIDISPSFHSILPSTVTLINQHAWTYPVTSARLTQVIGQLPALPLHLTTILPTSHWNGHSTHPSTSLQHANHKCCSDLILVILFSSYQTLNITNTKLIENYKSLDWKTKCIFTCLVLTLYALSQFGY